MMPMRPDRPARLALARWAVAGILLAGTGCAQLPARPVPPPATAGEALVVFDIDGTLTPAVAAVFQVRPDAAAAVRAYAAKGYRIVYLSTRTGWLSAPLPGWLHRHGFPDGTVHVAQRAAERRDPATYKARMLEAYRERGWRIAYAYGDSSTDFAAYAAAGVPTAAVFALRRRGQTGCQPGPAAGCLPGWSDHLAFIAGVPAAQAATAAPGARTGSP